MTSPLAQARAHDKAGRPSEALEEAWRALDAANGGAPEKWLVASLLRRHPELAAPARRKQLFRLVGDPALEPTYLARAGWSLLMQEGAFPPDEDPVVTAGRLEADALALRLLEESFVSSLPAELSLTAVRRRLLLSGAWSDHPRLAAALVAQAAHNGGAWFFDAEERRQLAAAPDSAFAAAYLPPRPISPAPAGFSDPVTDRVAEQYRVWPYPVWTRITVPEPSTLTEEIRAVDPGGAQVPAAADLLVAGCGTGLDAAMTACRFPDARIMAIDVSATSLAYAAGRCAGLGIEFRQLDLHRVAELGKRFDIVYSSGVLHHLPDPEAGLAALADALRPGGVMRILVYSRIARLRVRAAREEIADLLDRPVSDDLLREARRRLIETAPQLVAGTSDFYTLGGVHDLLLHRHEDPFDVPRIRRALDRLGLDLLAFLLPTPAHRARYRQRHPDDPLFRSFDHWGALEKEEPFLFSRMYDFWCRKSG
ncbi:MAG: hypothetical protein QOI38_905 [Sphingomonadales bacterium]|nr:hypothetical protein [Sphingomonadales bacterium]